ncbi:endoplasmic reticulum lectin 1 isoform X2 [Copidosoma floridanum]|uniref:endoplasmic reticulum lectin 1 isoform X2 n=1 Tax=Copidosoma floridanum TaxID=29053 RepID=UPI0006C94ABD|nr:endoplasmic reticulum lectin 1 isoform X2 [Copidosoma floridanum]
MKTCPSKMFRLTCLALLLVNLFALGFGIDAKAFDDNVLFKFNWPGSSGADLLESQANAELYTITSPNKEKYQCLIPNLTDKEIASDQAYTGKNPIELLSVMFGPSGCSYKLDSYWTYELCHGRHVIQYHEERDVKNVEKQKYELGAINPIRLKALSAMYDELASDPNRKAKIPSRKIDGVNMTYVEMEMIGGTVCDINSKPRSVKVIYVCHQHEKIEVHSIKEVASCEYEAIVKTPWLCEHPDYRPQDTKENKIICKPLGNAPRKPRALMALEAERTKMKYQKVSESKRQKVMAIYHIDKDGQLRIEIHPVDVTGRPFSAENSLSYINHGSNVLKSNTLENFLNGDNCLQGGRGWWRFEFCYGRSVTQYHVESDGTKIIINLGEFDKDKHKKWIEANPEKKPKPAEQRKHVSHLYSQGSMCDETKKPRQTEVKLKCVKNRIGSPYSVSMYLEEHKTCEYELEVESRLLCDILEYADDTYGIINNEKGLINVDKLTSNLRVKEDGDKIARDGDAL